MGKRQSRAVQDLAMSDFSLILVLHLITSKYNHQWRGKGTTKI
jgi:hypothetical protein